MAVGPEAESHIRGCVLLEPAMVSRIHDSDIFAKQILRHVLGEFLLAAGTSQVALVVKNPSANERCWFNSWVGKIPWRRPWQPTPVFLPGESHGQRSLVGYSPRG